MPRFRLVRPVAVAALVLAAGLAAFQAWANNSDALWQVVDGQCVAHARDGDGPQPCLAVNPSPDAAYAVLKDHRGVAQLLLIPTRRVSGIDDPFILDGAAPNYWAHAWDERTRLTPLLGRPPSDDEVVLTINSIWGRSQNQLHIHIDCLRADIRDALERHRREIGPTWKPFPEPLSGHSYWAMRVDRDNLPGDNPFRLLADGIPQAKAEMGQYTLAVVAPKFDDKPGFVLLADRADPSRGDRGHAEELQDTACHLIGTAH